MRLVPSVTASFVLLVSMAVFAQEWIEYSSRADLFFVNFPVQPQVRDISYTSEFGATFPARVYDAEQGRSRYSVTVVDYTDAERIHTERAKQCHPLAHSGCAGSEDPDGVQGAGSWKYERAGAVDFVSFNVLRRKAEMTYFGWAAIDRVAGRYIHLTNPDRSRTFFAVYMHEDRLYILEATVPAGYPEPGLFQQSLRFLDKAGNPARYEGIYSNGYPAPPRAGGGRGAGANPARN